MTKMTMTHTDIDYNNGKACFSIDGPIQCVVSYRDQCARIYYTIICIGNYTVREVLMKNRTSVWRNVYNTASA